MQPHVCKPSRPELWRTIFLMRQLLPLDLARHVVGFIVAEERTWEGLAESGEYETLAKQLPECRLAAKRVLLGACRAGHPEIARLVLPLLPSEQMTRAIDAARDGGHLDLVQILVADGTTDQCYYCARLPSCKSRGGHLELIDNVLDRDAERWVTPRLYSKCGCAPRALAKPRAVQPHASHLLMNVCFVGGCAIVGGMVGGMVAAHQWKQFSK